MPPLYNSIPSDISMGMTCCMQLEVLVTFRYIHGYILGTLMSGDRQDQTSIGEGMSLGCTRAFAAVAIFNIFIEYIYIFVELNPNSITLKVLCCEPFVCWIRMMCGSPPCFGYKCCTIIQTKRSAAVSYGCGQVKTSSVYYFHQKPYMGVCHLLFNYAKVCPSPCGIVTLI